MYTETQDYSPAHAVEYLIETDNNESRAENDEEEQAEMIFQTNSVDDEQQIQEITHEQIENDIKNEEQIAQTIFTYEPKMDHENESTPHEEISYQESFVNEASTPVPSDLDSWLSSLKQTLLVKKFTIV